MDNFIILYLVLGLALLFWALIDLVQNDNLKRNQKAVLVVLQIALPVIGSIIYFQFKNRNRKRSTYFSR
ncbi:PLDc N-terminal domain-containing protein [Leeuwenhoekiella polynyae]|uniref:Phospholipase D-like protein n=1 Tax=Leeuwenhoekiella polynyae TaxID=1550906 RepID=A0A4Q0P827_9FLAO|nr:phospholipase D-like protein [Leeuwenhoekiella polynyae]